MKAWVLAVTIGLSLLGGPIARAADGCVPQTVGDTVAARLIDDMRRNVKDDLKQSMKQYAMQCLASIIQAGGFRRLMSFNVGDFLNQWLSARLGQILEPLTCGGGSGGGMAGEPNLTLFEAMAEAARESADKQARGVL